MTPERPPNDHMGVLVPLLELLGPLGNVLAAILGPTNRKIENKIDFQIQKDGQNEPQTIPKRVKNQDDKRITFLLLLEPSWIGLEAILGPILGSKKQKRWWKT